MRNSILMIVLFVLVGCHDSANAEIVTETNRDGIVYLNLDDLSFPDAFRWEHRAKGENHSFYWRGGLYTTDLDNSVKIAKTYNDGILQWVRNSDDLNDLCHSNEWDECGTCDGLGPFTWFLDRDEDGLGDPNTFTTNCTYPGADEE